jgi:cytochrome c peroxidase
MNKLNRYSIFIVLIILSVTISCGPEPMDNDDLTSIKYNPTTYNFDLPSHFPSMDIPANNPTTKEGISLGRHLFYDPIMSADSTQSCASCHLPEMSFTDGKAVSIGIDGIAGTRSSMSLINIAFVRSGLFWDGRAKTLEDQALLPVEDSIEMHHSWPKLEEQLRRSKRYPTMFREAFGIQNKSGINKELAVRAIAQFERTIISKDSKYDQIKQGKAKYTDLEFYGQGLYFDEDPDLPDSECWHCHNLPMATSDAFFNNGLTETSDLMSFVDKGRGNVTKSIIDNGKFRAPTLRNIKYSAPYMHDGRFATLDDVLNHYVSGGKSSPNSDPLIHNLPFSTFEIKALKAFIETLNDTNVYNNPALKNPFK